MERRNRTEKQKGLRSSSVGSMEVLEDHNRDSFLVVPGASNVSNLGVLPLPRTRQRCSAGNLLHPSYIKDTASRLLEADDSNELTAQLSDALGQTVVACDLELLEESSCDRPNGAVAAVPKLLRSIIDHNPNVFVSPSKPGVNNERLPSLPRQCHSGCIPSSGLPICDISPLPASTVPAPANHFAAEALPSTAAAQQTVAETPRKLVDAAEAITANDSVGRSTRKQPVRRNLSKAADTMVNGIIQQVSACSVTDHGNAVPQNLHTNAADADTATKRRRVRSVRLESVTCQSDEMSSDAVSTRTLTASKSETNVSDSSINSSNLSRLRKSSSSNTAIVKNSGSLPVVKRSSSAVSAAAVAVAACVVVIEKSSSTSRHCAVRNTMLVDGHNEKGGTTSRSKRRKSHTADNDVEPDEAVLTNSYRYTASSHAEVKSSKRRCHTAESRLDNSAECKRLVAIIGGILRSTDGVEFVASVGGTDDSGNEVDYPASPISCAQLHELRSETSKLRLSGALQQVPCETLVQLLRVLPWSLRSGCTLIPQVDLECDESEDEMQQLITLLDNQVIPGLDAASVALSIMTADEMPKEVFVEDTIEWVVKLVKWHLLAIVYPHCSMFKGDRRRIHVAGAKDRVMRLYYQLADIVALLAELVRRQKLTDEVLLQISSTAVSPFFVEDVHELQLNSLKLISAVFNRYDTHRQLILEDILSSLASLPSNKKNSRTYRLNSEENVQMVTALILQLIQSIIKLPDDGGDLSAADAEFQKELEVSLLKSYEESMKTAHKFLSVFLSKCVAPKGKGENDYRPLFDVFVHDLLTMTNMPEWPSAELMLKILGGLLVVQASAKSVDKSSRETDTKPVDKSARVAALDYLGTIASRLRKDAVAVSIDQNAVNNIVSLINSDIDDVEQNNLVITDMQEKIQLLRKALMDYLVCISAQDFSILFARKFYLAQWYRECTMAITKSSGISAEAASVVSKSASKKKKSRRESDDSESVDTDHCNDVQMELKQMQQWLLQQMLTSLPPATSRLNGESAHLISQYLVSQRPVSLNFDVYLRQILEMLSEVTIAVRTKALKCLASVIEVDPTVLAWPDVQGAVHGRFHDSAISVREASIDLVGRFLIVQRDLTDQYYPMLAERILDTGVSVRKRVIKIFRDICTSQPDFEKIPEMCIKMIARIDDEETVKKLVVETFEELWFAAVNRTCQDADAIFVHRTSVIVDIMTQCRTTGYGSFQQLLDNLLKVDEDHRLPHVEMACKQIVDCLVQTSLNAANERSGALLANCTSALFYFSKARPQYFVPHCSVIESFLSTRWTSADEQLVLGNVISIMEHSVAHISHPSEMFLTQIETNVVQLMLSSSSPLVKKCVQCLAVLINKVTHNCKLISDCFKKFYDDLTVLITASKNMPPPVRAYSAADRKRALFTIGLISKHFDFADIVVDTIRVRDSVFDVFMYFIHNSPADVCFYALRGLGYFLTRHSELMLTKQLKDMYHRLLTAPAGSPTAIQLLCQVLTNIHLYLVEEELKMMKAEAEWKKVHKVEDLKDMQDVQSGMASTVMQLYLKPVLESYFHVEPQVRLCATDVAVIVLRQGLVHVAVCIPHVLAMATDRDCDVRNKAELQLIDVNKQHPTFIQTKSTQGMKLSYRLHKLLQSSSDNGPVRGIRLSDSSEMSVANSLYTLVRGNRANRRYLVTTLLKMFEDDSVALSELLFVADNLAYFSYQQLDEPLFVMNQIDVIVSTTGSSVLDMFTEVFHPDACNQRRKHNESTDDDDDDDVDPDALLSSFPSEVSKLQEAYMTSQRYVLLLSLMQFLKESFGITDSKVRDYAPSQALKIYSKPVTRKSGIKFDPHQVIDLVRRGSAPSCKTQAEKANIVTSFVEFRAQILSIDRNDDINNDVEPSNDDDVEPADEEQTTAEPSTHAASVVGNRRRTRKKALPKPKIRTKRRRRKRVVETDDSSDDDDDD